MIAMTEQPTRPIHYNAAGTHVLVFHPDMGQRWECPPDYLPTALSRGWELAEPEPTDDAASDADESGAGDNTGDDGAELFDPAKHDKDAVEAHLAAHAESDPVEVIRVIELERTGKARKTITVPEGFEPIVPTVPGT